MSEERLPEDSPMDNLQDLIQALSLDALRCDQIKNVETGAIGLLPRTLPIKDWEIAAAELTAKQNAERKAIMAQESLEETSEEDESWESIDVKIV